MPIERLLAEGDSTAIDAPIIRDIDSGSIAVDYSSYYNRLTLAVESLSESLTTIAENTTTIAENTTTIAEKLSDIEIYQKRLKELGETTGIHVVGPYDWLGLINIYRALIEQGGILDTQGNVGESKIAESIATINTYIEKIQRFPTGF